MTLGNCTEDKVHKLSNKDTSCQRPINDDINFEPNMLLVRMKTFSNNQRRSFIYKKAAFA